MARIVLESGGPPRSYPVARVLIIGRHSGCGVVIDDSQSSRENTGLSFDGRAYILRDLGSRNGTFLNENPVGAPEVLYPGDRIRIGKTIFVFELDRDDAGLAPELRVPRPPVPAPAPAPAPVITARPMAPKRAPIVFEGPALITRLFYWLILLAILVAGSIAARQAFLWAFDRGVGR